MSIAGLPPGFAIRSIQAVQRGTYVTLVDGTVWEQGVAGSWYDTGLSGVDVADIPISGHFSSSSGWGGALMLLPDGSLYAVRTWGGSLSLGGAIDGPAGGTVVEIGGNNGYFAVEMSDGTLWVTFYNGTATPVWKPVTGLPPGVTVKEWTSSAQGTISVIGTDGKLYGGFAPGQPSPTLSPARAADAAWIEPAQSFSSYHGVSGWESSLGLIDANGNLFNITSAASQSVDLSGVLAGTLIGAEVYAAPQTGGAANFYVVRDGRVYRAPASTATGFIDITPPQTLLGGATIVSAHNGVGNGGVQSYAIDSNGRVWWSGSTGGTPNWQEANVPVTYTAAGIIQNNNAVYVLEAQTVCA